MKNLLFFFPILLSIVILFTSCEDDDTVAPAPTPSYTNALDYAHASGFQGSMLLRRGDEDLIRRGFGEARAGEGIMNATDTQFRIGSMSKAFTVLGILQLQRTGLIESLDQTISAFAPEFPYGSQITLRHLMAHTSGLPDHVAAFEELYEQQNAFLTPEDIVLKAFKVLRNKLKTIKDLL